MWVLWLPNSMDIFCSWKSCSSFLCSASYFILFSSISKNNLSLPLWLLTTSFTILIIIASIFSSLIHFLFFPLMAEGWAPLTDELEEGDSACEDQASSKCRSLYSLEPLSSSPPSSEPPSSSLFGCSDVYNTTDGLVVGLWPRTASMVSKNFQLLLVSPVLLCLSFTFLNQFLVFSSWLCIAQLSYQCLFLQLFSQFILHMLVSFCSRKLLLYAFPHPSPPILLLNLSPQYHSKLPLPLLTPVQLQTAVAMAYVYCFVN